jgi:gliding motility-associated-like protein
MTIFLAGIHYSCRSQQACSTLGQNPYSAFPVCGSTTFSQQSVPICGGRTIHTLCTDGTIYTDKNPFWYKFTCYTAGTLGFVITPLAQNEDYDWQLFDITGHDPMDVYAVPSLYVSSNWSGSYGPTGTSATARNPYECSSRPDQNVSTFSTMPTLIVGHEYILLVSHFSDTQSGYTLSFGGGTASIVNPVIPLIKNAYAVCDGTQIVVVLNKKVKCRSIDADGSDFKISGPGNISIISATGNQCTSSFDSDSILLKLNNILSPGTYTVTVQAGADGNTLVDNCDNQLAVGANASLNFTPARPTPMDSISPVLCITDTLQLVFKNPIKCNSIAPDGSDFIISGPIPVSVKGAAGICSSGAATIIRIFLTAPIKTNGSFRVKLVNGSDGNTLINECGEITPAGSTINFTTQNITTADFQSAVTTGCKYDLLTLTHNGNNNVNQWNWNIDDGNTSAAQSPVFKYNTFGLKTIRLLVSNGKCSDSSSGKISLPDLTTKAAFNVRDSLCPADTLLFTDASNSSSGVTKWNWNFGNGVQSALQAPPAQSYPIVSRTIAYTARLVVTNNSNCSDTAYKSITLLASCYVAVPSAFTPNGDGLNDYLYPLNTFKAGNMIFRIFNRYGQVIFESRDPGKKWDGNVNGMQQASGTYVWALEFTHKDTGRKIFMNGTTVLIR